MLDSWTDKQIQQMMQGGNEKCREFLTSHGVDMSSETPLREKYDTPSAELYRQVLLARVEGRPEPTELPKTAASSGGSRATSGRSNAVPVVDPSRLTGFGSSPPPKPTPPVNTVAVATTAAVVVGAALLWAVSHV